MCPCVVASRTRRDSDEDAGTGYHRTVGMARRSSVHSSIHRSSIGFFHTKTAMTETGATQATSDERAALRTVRQRLLVLHKALLDNERSRHEREHGPIETAQQHLQMLIGHPSFAWLRPLSGLIVQIDDRLASREGVLSSQIRELAADVRSLTSLGDEPTEYRDRYRAAIDGSPGVLAAHADVARALAPLLGPSSR